MEVLTTNAIRGFCLDHKTTEVNEQVDGLASRNSALDDPSMDPVYVLLATMKGRIYSKYFTVTDFRWQRTTTTSFFAITQL